MSGLVSGYNSQATRSLTSPRFALCQYYERNTWALAAYATFLLISIIPLLIIAAMSFSHGDMGYELLMGFITFIHQLNSSPVMPIAEGVAFLMQARHITSVQFPNALSLSGLAIKAVVFLVVAITWIWRIWFPYELGIHPIRDFLPAWYEFIGCFVVDNIVFAAGQLAILWLAIYRGNWPVSSAGEQNRCCIGLLWRYNLSGTHSDKSSNLQKFVSRSLGGSPPLLSFQVLYNLST